MTRSEAHRKLIKNFSAICLGMGVAGVGLSAMKIDEFVEPERSAIREHGIRVVAIRDGMKAGKHQVSPVAERYVARVEEAADFRKDLGHGDPEVTAVYADGFMEGRSGGWDPQAFERYAGMVANSPARITEMMEEAQGELVRNGFPQGHSYAMSAATIRVAAYIEDPDRPDENIFSSQIDEIVSGIPDIERLYAQTLEMRSVLRRASEMEPSNDFDRSRPVEATHAIGLDR